MYTNITFYYFMLGC